MRDDYSRNDQIGPSAAAEISIAALGPSLVAPAGPHITGSAVLGLSQRWDVLELAHLTPS